MLKLGEYHTLRIKKRTDYGLYLDGGDEGNILLPNRYVTKDMRIGDEIEVFIYLDQDANHCYHRASDSKSRRIRMDGVCMDQ